jgi:hypothetical protein
MGNHQKMTIQPDLFPSHAPAETKISEAERADFRAQLISAGTWQTRADLCAALGWPDRKVRAAAESLGAEVVRCQRGFKLLEQIVPEEVPLVKEAIATFHSQAEKMEDYSKSLRYRLAART